MRATLDPYLIRILTEEPELRRTNLVGGCVRDFILRTELGRNIAPSADIDLEVFGVEKDRLGAILSKWGRVDDVGKAFGVFKVKTPDGASYDFAQPRTEKKTGPKHGDFEVSTDLNMPIEVAVRRRDFRMNAMAFSVTENRIIDPFNGAEDLRKGVLTHTSAAFEEDIVRPLRAMRFCGVFDLKAAPETLALCQKMVGRHADIEPSQIRAEWGKWAAHSTAPEAGLNFLVDSGWIKTVPEVDAINQGTRQSPVHHPEGDVFTHTKHCCRSMANNPEWRKRDAEDRKVYMFAILSHDMAKPACTEIKTVDGQEKITSYGHEAAGGPVSRDFLKSIHQPDSISDRVQPLVENHMAYINAPTKSNVGRLARRLSPDNIDGVFLVWQADVGGRPPLSPELPAQAHAYVEMAQKMGVNEEPAKPLVNGRDLMELGLPAGRELGVILKSVLAAQVDEGMSNKNEALAWLRGQGSIPPLPDAAPFVR